MNSPRERIKQFKQELLKERLSLCNKKQQDFFKKIFPKGISKDKYYAALDLVERTIAKNELS